MPDPPAARLQLSASYSFTMRLHMPQHAGAFASIARAVADTEALLGAIDLVRVERGEVVCDLAVSCVDAEDITVVVIGAGAAGLACADILLAHGVAGVIVCNRRGALHPDDSRLDPNRAAPAERTNKGRRRGTADEMLEGADLLLGLSGPAAVSAAAVRRMAPDAVGFAMANPVPEVQPEELQGDVAIIATGRSDYPNQINNVLAFPGVFKGALEVRARINEQMKLAPLTRSPE